MNAIESGKIWCITPAAGRLILDAALALTSMPQVNDERGIRWLSGGRAKRGASVAVLPVHGMIDKRRSFLMDWFGGTATDEMAAVFDELVASPDVKGIVLDVDSPGGSAVGPPVLAQKIMAARDKKPIVAVSNAEMNSAAYWIGSAAHKVFASPDSSTGSVGVWSAAMEYSKALENDGVGVKVWRSSGSPFKAEFLPYETFTQDAIDNEQMQVDRIYSEFLSAVANQRGVSVSQAQKQFGQGRTLDAKAAVAAGLVDGVATLETIVGRMTSGRLSLGTMNNAAEIVADPGDWREHNETERLRSELRMKGILNGDSR